MATETPPAPPAAKKKEVSDPNPQAPKYSRTESAEAEKRVADNAAQAAQKRAKTIDETVAKLLKEFEGYGDSARSDALNEISRRVMSIKTVAANAHLRPARSHIMAEEDASMPRLAPGIDPGGDVRRNIMAQGDQNVTKPLKGEK